MASIIVAQELYKEFRIPKRYPGFLGSIRTLFTREYDPAGLGDLGLGLDRYQSTGS